MAIDITKGSHIRSFPNKVASMMGQYSHVYNIVLQANADNGTLAGRGNYVSFDQYQSAAAPANFAGRINEQAANGDWYVEVTALGTGETLYIYNSPVSPYKERELQDETLFYNKQGDVAQGAVLCVGDVFTISAAGFTGTPAAGKTVSYSSGKYVVSNS